MYIEAMDSSEIFQMCLKYLNYLKAKDILSPWAQLAKMQGTKYTRKSKIYFLIFDVIVAL